MDTAYGPWRPLLVTEAADLFSRTDRRWWISGGHALRLHLGRTWREHADTDVAVLRQDCPVLVPWLEALSGCSAWLAAAGTLSRYRGQELQAAHHENNIWLRRGEDGPWVLDLTVSHGSAASWQYRRDESFVLPWVLALRRAGGIPYLAPALQLLYKSVHPRPKDTVDAGEVIPTLSAGEVALLGDRLPERHPWRALLPLP